MNIKLFFILVFFYSIVSLAQSRIGIDEAFQISERIRNEVSLILVNWQEAEVEREPVVFQHLAGDTSVYLFKVYHKDKYVGYISTGAYDYLPPHIDATTAALPTDDSNINSTLNTFLKTLGNKTPQIIRFLSFGTNNYYVEILSEGRYYYGDLLTDKILSKEEILNYYKRSKNHIDKHREIIFTNREKYELVQFSAASSVIIDEVEPYTWYRGCFPTSATMMLNYYGLNQLYEQLRYDVSTFDWLYPWDSPPSYPDRPTTARELNDAFANFYYLPEESGLVQDYGVARSEQPDGIISIADDHSYSFSSSLIINFSATDLVFEIDNDRPVKYGIPGHAQCGFGYSDNGNNIYYYDTYDQSMHNQPITTYPDRNIVTAIPNIKIPDQYSTIEEALENVSPGQKIIVTHGSNEINNITEVPPHIMLIIESNASLRLNGHSIVSSGGTIYCYTENIVPYSIKRREMGNDPWDVIGLYSYIQDALAEAGENEYINCGSDTYDLTENLFIPTAVTLAFDDVSTIDLGSDFYIKSSGTGQIHFEGEFSVLPRDIYSTEGGIRKGQYPHLQSALDNAAEGRGVNFGGTHVGDFTMDRRLILRGYNSSSNIEGSLTMSSSSDYGFTLENFQVTGNLIANSVFYVVLEDIVMTGLLFLDFSFADLYNCASITSGSHTRCYGADVLSYDYDITAGNTAIDARDNSDLEFYDGEITHLSEAIRLSSNTFMVFTDTEFCQNSRRDIMVFEPGSYCDAYGVATWSGDPAIWTEGDVGYDDDFVICDPGSQVASYNLDVERQPENSSYKNNDGLKKYIKIREVVVEIRKLQRADLKENGSIDLDLYKALYAKPVEKLKKVVSKFPGEKSSLLALSTIMHCYMSTKDYQSLVSYVNEVVNDDGLSTITPYALNLLIPYQLAVEDYLSALNLSDQIMNDYPDAGLSEDLLFGKGLIYKYYLHDDTAAEQVFMQVLSLYSDSPIAEWAQTELSTLGKESPQSEDIETVSIPEKFTLNNYPNPFNPTTTIEFGLPEDGYVTVEIYDMTGRLTRTIISGEKQAGEHNVVWDAVNENNNPVASGIYFCRVRYNDQVLSRKLVLMR